MMSGDAKAALALAEHLQPKIDALRAKPQAWAQGQTRPAYFALGRYGDPAKVLAMADPGEALPFMRAMWRYARGEALARQGDAAGVRAEARQLRLSAADLKGAGANAGSAKAMVEIARHVLLGRAAMLEGRFDEAAREFKAGADIQRAKFPDGGDPPPWWYPVRRSVAAAELRAGRYEQAIATANGVLKEWPSDPMTLTVLAMSERALGRTAEADGHFAQARAGWAGDLTHITPMDV
jgi:tetratricopeptide (TPR) repeat protein